jgi:midasin (ATPase involved in ribosome maturation)
METEVLEVIISGLIEDDLDRIRKAVRENREDDLHWVRSVLDEGHTGYAHMDARDLYEEFHARGLRLTTFKRETTGIAGVDA